MSFVIITIIKCNGCEEAELKQKSNVTMKKSTEMLAREKGWTIVDDKHYCLKCTIARSKEG